MAIGSLPRISVVTPSLNQVEFVEQAILSVLGQGYPDCEYLVMDGGSTDGSVDVIRRHEDPIAFWRSEADGGQAAAINEGFRRATGDVLCWLNSDDYFLPGTLTKVGRLLAGNTKEAKVVYGGAFVFDEGGTWGAYEPPVPFDLELLRRRDFIVQPSAFWTRAAWDSVGELDESLRFVFDWEWFLRAAKSVSFETISACLSGYRIHPGHKTGVAQDARRNELMTVLKRYAPQTIVDHYEYLVTRLGCWDALRTWGDRQAALERNGVPLSNAVATLLTPGGWSIPARFDRRILRDGVFFL